nr:hypothetical protein [Tanacetum cinerariifolium]
IPILPPSDDRERDEVDEATILTLTLHETALDAEAQENIAKVQEKLDEEEIKKMVEGEEDEESYASVFADSMINEDVNDFATLSPTTATTSKDSSTSKYKKKLFHTRRRFFQEVLLTNEMINKEMPRLGNLTLNKDREVDPINAQEMISKEFATHAKQMLKELFRKHMHHTTLNVYPTISSSTTGKSTTNLQ